MTENQKLRDALRIAVNYIDMDALYTSAGGDHDTIKEALALPTAAPGGEREAFEAEMRCEETWGHRSLARKKLGGYSNWCVDLMWSVWQARATLSAQAARDERDKVDAERNFAVYEAISAIYFGDGSDYLPALYSVVRLLAPDLREMLSGDHRSVSNAWHIAEQRKNAAIAARAAKGE